MYFTARAGRICVSKQKAAAAAAEGMLGSVMQCSLLRSKLPLTAAAFNANRIKFIILA